MDIHRSTVFKVLTVSLPFIVCLLLSWPSSTTTTDPPGPSSSVVSAAQILRARGYSVIADAMLSASSANNANFSGTVLAPPDFAFSFAAAKFSSKPCRRAPSRPSTALLRFHTLQTSSLRWLSLSSRHDGDELQTNLNNYCLFLFKNANGNIALSSSQKPIHAVTIRQPDLYSADTLTIHGVDGLLDPTAAQKCSFSSNNNPTTKIQSPADRSFLNHAIRVLRTRGFHVVATAMALRRSDLLNLKAVTIFAPSDVALFSVPNGFRYDFRQHVVPERLYFRDILTFPDGKEFETLAPKKTVCIRSGDGGIWVNEVRVEGGKLYHNQWIVVYPISITLDDDVDDYHSSLPESQFPSKEEIQDSVSSAAPERKGELNGAPSPSQESDISCKVGIAVPVIAPVSDQGQLHDITSTESIGPPSASASPSLEMLIPAEVGREVLGIAPTSNVKPVAPSFPSPEILIPAEAGLEVPGIAPMSTVESLAPAFPSPERQIPDEVGSGAPVFAPLSGRLKIPDITGNSIGPPSPSSAIDEVTDMHCITGSPNDFPPGSNFEIEGGDLFCPVNNAEDL